MCILRFGYFTFGVVYIVTVDGPVDVICVLLACGNECDDVGCRGSEGCTIGRVVVCVTAVLLFAREVCIGVFVCEVAAFEYKYTAFCQLLKCCYLIAKLKTIFRVGEVLCSTCCDTYCCGHVLAV